MLFGAHPDLGQLLSHVDLPHSPVDPLPFGPRPKMCRLVFRLRKKKMKRADVSHVSPFRLVPAQKCAALSFGCVQEKYETSRWSALTPSGSTSRRSAVYPKP